jgi:hypothetical protein
MWSAPQSTASRRNSTAKAIASGRPDVSRTITSQANLRGDSQGASGRSNRTVSADCTGKRHIRERAAKTGECYAVARMHELAREVVCPDVPMEGESVALTDEDREELAALWIEIGMKRMFRSTGTWLEPFMFGMTVHSMAGDWPGKKEIVDDIDRRMKALANRLTAQGDAAVREWIASRDRSDVDRVDQAHMPAAEALLDAWLGLRRGMGIKVYPVLLAHELADFGDPRTWRQARSGLRRMRWLITQQQGTTATIS